MSIGVRRLVVSCVMLTLWLALSRRWVFSILVLGGLIGLGAWSRITKASPYSTSATPTGSHRTFSAEGSTPCDGSTSDGSAPSTTPKSPTSSPAKNSPRACRPPPPEFIDLSCESEASREAYGLKSSCVLNDAKGEHRKHMGQSDFSSFLLQSRMYQAFRTGKRECKLTKQPVSNAQSAFYQGLGFFQHQMLGQRHLVIPQYEVGIGYLPLSATSCMLESSRQE